MLACKHIDDYKHVRDKDKELKMIKRLRVEDVLYDEMMLSLGWWSFCKNEKLEAMKLCRFGRRGSPRKHGRWDI